ncbi:MAG: hypothetical protein HY939_05700 [Gammaproteobacteria bacterium]|nr:hypothetical protein [Gammaproteobacteria bacterium]
MSSIGEFRTDLQKVRLAYRNKFVAKSDGLLRVHKGVENDENDTSNKSESIDLEGIIEKESEKIINEMVEEKIKEVIERMIEEKIDNKLNNFLLWFSKYHESDLGRNLDYRVNNLYLSRKWVLKICQNFREKHGRFEDFLRRLSADVVLVLRPELDKFSGELLRYEESELRLIESGVSSLSTFEGTMRFPYYSLQIAAVFESIMSKYGSLKCCVETILSCCTLLEKYQAIKKNYLLKQLDSFLLFQIDEETSQVNESWVEFEDEFFSFVPVKMKRILRVLDEILVEYLIPTDACLLESSLSRLMPIMKYLQVKMGLNRISIMTYLPGLILISFLVELKNYEDVVAVSVFEFANKILKTMPYLFFLSHFELQELSNKIKALTSRSDLTDEDRDEIESMKIRAVTHKINSWERAFIVLSFRASCISLSDSTIEQVRMWREEMLNKLRTEPHFALCFGGHDAQFTEVMSLRERVINCFKPYKMYSVNITQGTLSNRSRDILLYGLSASEVRLIPNSMNQITNRKVMEARSDLDSISYSPRFFSGSNVSMGCPNGSESEYVEISVGCPSPR